MRAAAERIDASAGVDTNTRRRRAFSRQVADCFATLFGSLFRLFHTRHYRPVRATLYGQKSMGDTPTLHMRKDVTYRPQSPGL
jgi:hypothetical protein